MIFVRWFLFVAVLSGMCVPASAETPQQWITLGTRTHGGFGSLIPLGIRIGLDARSRLRAGPRTLSVSYETGAIAPCPCVVDGIGLALIASPGQESLRVVERKTRLAYGVATIADPRRGMALVYTIPASAAPILDALNRPTVSDRERFDAVMRMRSERLFTVRRITLRM
jgi:hypothetical protein